MPVSYTHLFGVTIPVICGGCDLSVGGTLCLGGIVAIGLINLGLPIWVGFLAAIACGALVGVINGFLIVHQRTEPFIITLGMGMLLKGVCQQLTNAHPLPCTAVSYTHLCALISARRSPRWSRIPRSTLPRRPRSRAHTSASSGSDRRPQNPQNFRLPERSLLSGNNFFVFLEIFLGNAIDRTGDLCYHKHIKTCLLYTSSSCPSL